MDGKQKQYYVKANSEYKIELVSALSDNNAGNVIEDFTLFYEKDPSLSGKPVPFIAVDDMASPHLYSGKAKFKIYSPDGLFPEREFELELVSGIVQPEANTYMLKAGAKQGIFIPVSRVNTAYEYYNMLLEHDAVLSGKQGLPGSKSDFMLNKLDEDDDWKVNIVWTDIQKSDEQNDIESTQRSGLIHAGFHEARATWDNTIGRRLTSRYGAGTLYGQAFKPVPLASRFMTPARPVGTGTRDPTTPATQPPTGITRNRFGLIRFRSPLLTEYPFLQVLRCFTSLRTPRP